MASPAPSVPFSNLLGRQGCWVLDGPGGGGCKDKWESISKILDLLVSTGRVPAARRDAIHAALLDREKSMSTGMERGIALPHAAVDGLEELVTCLVVFRQGVPFQSIDGGPARIVVMLLIPKERRIVYLPVLAEAARLLSREEVREGLLKAASSHTATGLEPAPELHAVIAAAEISAKST
ncbi:MAG: PTS sugar transporter subunit IIA [Planctomycetes bacterium]|nr:PTS sugar transporter subunit IIA [Planctomycetota bacterium]